MFEMKTWTFFFGEQIGFRTTRGSPRTCTTLTITAHYIKTKLFTEHHSYGIQNFEPMILKANATSWDEWNVCKCCPRPPINRFEARDDDVAERRHHQGNRPVSCQWWTCWVLTTPSGRASFGAVWAHRPISTSRRPFASRPRRAASSSACTASTTTGSTWKSPSWPRSTKVPNHLLLFFVTASCFSWRHFLFILTTSFSSDHSLFNRKQFESDFLFVLSTFCLSWWLPGCFATTLYLSWSLPVCTQCRSASGGHPTVRFTRWTWRTPTCRTDAAIHWCCGWVTSSAPAWEPSSTWTADWPTRWRACPAWRPSPGRRTPWRSDTDRRRTRALRYAWPRLLAAQHEYSWDHVTKASCPWYEAVPHHIVVHFLWSRFFMDF